MEELVPATKLEMWCEAWWRDHGHHVRMVERNTAFTIYRVDGEEVRVPLLTAKAQEEFKRQIMERYE